jgi:hypothetical protein
MDHDIFYQLKWHLTHILSDLGIDTSVYKCLEQKLSTCGLCYEHITDVIYVICAHPNVHNYKKKKYF